MAGEMKRPPAAERRYQDLRHMFIRGLIDHEKYQRKRAWLKSAAEWTSRAIVSLDLCDDVIKSVKQASRLEGIGGELGRKLKEIAKSGLYSKKSPVRGLCTSSASALLVAMLQAQEELHSEVSDCKEVLLPETLIKQYAQASCEETFLDLPEGSQNSVMCPAMWRINVLCNRGFIKKRQQKKKPVYQLLPPGQQMAQKLKGFLNDNSRRLKSRQNTVPLTNQVNDRIQQEAALYTNDDGKDGLILMVDTQEWGGDHVGLGQLVNMIKDAGMRFRTRKLPLADYRWLWRIFGTEITLPVLVERKRADDFARSMKDGRYSSQKVRMVEWKQQLDRQGVSGHLVYLVEGAPEQYTVRCADGCGALVMCGYPTVQQVQEEIQILNTDPDFDVHRTSDIKETVRFLAALSADLQLRIDMGDFDTLITMESVVKENSGTSSTAAVPAVSAAPPAVSAAPNVRTHSFTLFGDASQDTQHTLSGSQEKKERQRISPKSPTLLHNKNKVIDIDSASVCNEKNRNSNGVLKEYRFPNASEQKSASSKHRLSQNIHREESKSKKIEECRELSEPLTPQNFNWKKTQSNSTTTPQAMSGLGKESVDKENHNTVNKIEKKKSGSCHESVKKKCKPRLSVPCGGAEDFIYLQQYYGLIPFKPPVQESNNKACDHSVSSAQIKQNASPKSPRKMRDNQNRNELHTQVVHEEVHNKVSLLDDTTSQRSRDNQGSESLTLCEIKSQSPVKIMQSCQTVPELTNCTETQANEVLILGDNHNSYEVHSGEPSPCKRKTFSLPSRAKNRCYSSSLPSFDDDASETDNKDNQVDFDHSTIKGRSSNSCPTKPLSQRTSEDTSTSWESLCSSTSVSLSPYKKIKLTPKAEYSQPMSVKRNDSLFGSHHLNPPSKSKPPCVTDISKTPMDMMEMDDYLNRKETIYCGGDDDDDNLSESSSHSSSLPDIDLNTQSHSSRLPCSRIDLTQPSCSYSVLPDSVEDYALPSCSYSSNASDKEREKVNTILSILPNTDEATVIRNLRLYRGDLEFVVSVLLDEN